MWAIGLASLRCDLNMVPLGKDQYSWVLRSDGALMHNNIAIDNIQLTVSEGDYLVSCQFSFVLTQKHLRNSIRNRDTSNKTINFEQCIFAEVLCTLHEYRKHLFFVMFEAKYSRMDQADHITSNFLKAVFHKFYLVHS